MAGATSLHIPFGEYQAEWSYYLYDGTGSVRQMADGQGHITATRSFTPWGEILEPSGQSGLTTGYLGGMLDAATGLIYVGNGQYYDAATGRFLTRSANPTQPNPYVPWRSDPAGAMLAPLALLAMVYGRKKKRGKWDQIVILLVISGAVGLSLSACGSQPTEVKTPTATATITSMPNQTVQVEVTATTVPGKPTLTLILTPTETPEPICGPIPSTQPSLIIFGGSGNDATQEGPEVPNFHMTAWKNEHLPSYDIAYQRYQLGGKAVTARVADSREDLAKKENVALICYSGGTEACLMYAELRQKKNLKTETIVLLGGSFNTIKDLDGNPAQGFESWNNKINGLVSSGMTSRVLLINDLQGETANAGFLRGGDYEYHDVNIDHFCIMRDDRTCWRPSSPEDEEDSIVDKSPTLRDAILQWIDTSCWNLPENWSPTQ